MKKDENSSTSSLPSAADISLSQSIDLKSQLKSSQNSLAVINERLRKIASDNPTDSETEVCHKIANDDVATTEKSNEWTKSYGNWEKWNEKEELQEKKSVEETKIDSLIAKADNLGHVHDHSEERDFFQQPESVKFEQCISYRNLGNYYCWEGDFLSAVKAFETAIGYYDYCFPEDEIKQTELDTLRVACHCNLSLCYIRMEAYRQAVESASNAVIESKGKNPKAFYRRGQAYRLLDEYE
jgi:tetratricopeptide (TPR) repeat protein